MPGGVSLPSNYSSPSSLCLLSGLCPQTPPVAMRFLAPSLLLYLSFLLDEVPIAHAIRLPLRARMGGFGNSGLARRASLTGTPDLTNQGNMQYQTNITLNGQSFQVLIDTGRSVPLRAPRHSHSSGGRTQFGLVCGGKRERREGHWQERLGHLRDRFHERCVFLAPRCAHLRMLMTSSQARSRPLLWSSRGSRSTTRCSVSRVPRPSLTRERC